MRVHTVLVQPQKPQFVFTRPYRDIKLQGWYSEVWKIMSPKTHTSMSTNFQNNVIFIKNNVEKIPDFFLSQFHHLQSRIWAIFYVYSAPARAVSTNIYRPSNTGFGVWDLPQKSSTRAKFGTLGLNWDFFGTIFIPFWDFQSLFS